MNEKQTITLVNVVLSHGGGVFLGGRGEWQTADALMRRGLIKPKPGLPDEYRCYVHTPAGLVEYQRHLQITDQERNVLAWVAANQQPPRNQRKLPLQRALAHLLNVYLICYRSKGRGEYVITCWGRAYLKRHKTS